MFFYQGLKCPVCDKEFTENDDVVSCPECGAPHHRECWKSEGHCHFEDTHGTPDQWKKEDEEPKKIIETKRCPNCGYENSPFVDHCISCGTPMCNAAQNAKNESQGPKYQEFSPFRVIRVDNFGGVSANDTIEEESVEDIAAVVGPNTAYYLPKFNKMSKEKSAIQWNWASFILTPYWLLFRKNYLIGGLLFLFEIIQTIFVTYIEVVKLSFLFPDGYSMQNVYDGLQSLLETNSPLTKYIYLIALFSFISFGLHILFGLLGNYVYMHTCLNRIRNTKELNPTGYKADLRKVGGISFSLACLAYFACYFMPTIAELFLKSF